MWFFQLYFLLLHRNPIDMMVRCGGREEAFYSPMFRTQSFSELVSPGYDLPKCFAVLLFFLLR